MTPRGRKRPARAPSAEQLSVFTELEPPRIADVEQPPDTMRQIVSLRMPDSLLERVETAARLRGVSPSSLMRALIAAGLDRSYAAVSEAPPTDVAAQLAELRRTVAAMAERLGVGPQEGGR